MDGDYADADTLEDDEGLCDSRVEMQMRLMEYEAELRTLRMALESQRSITAMMQAELINSSISRAGKVDDDLDLPPLVMACKLGNMDMIELLLPGDGNNKALMDMALLVACQNGRTAAASRLVDAGADLHVDHDSALLWACRTGNVELVKALLERGANAHVLGGCALRIAVKAGFKDVAGALLSHGSGSATA